ncbi:MAG TPA: DUF3313 family protein [Phenylobacterium sp.]|uniref:DUF3313 family protein n=1 Tax=Phenylobacterium sp. TaxID=1871053 RepID=UPI002F92C6CE
MTRRALAMIAALCIAAPLAPPVVAAEPAAASWDGLTRVQSRRMAEVDLLPGADFRGYTKVMLDPTEVAFRRNWQRDHNASALSGRITDADAQRILDAARTGFEEIFRTAYEQAGYQVVTEPGPDVLRMRTAVANLHVSAPDVRTAGRTRVFSRDAGSATVVIEARDSLSGALLGRAVDTRTAGDARPFLRNSVTNRADFRSLFQTWARTSVEGLAELKAMSPIPEPAS